MLTRIAWKNVWRSKSRSMVVIAAIALGLWATIFIMAFTWGMYDQRIHEAIDNEVSHIQIHAQHYKDDNDVHLTIANSYNVLQQLQANDSVKGASGRVIVSGMVASAMAGTGCKINGIMPNDEEKVTRLSKKIKEGGYFEEGQHVPVIIGQKIAEKLKVKIHSKIVLTFQSANGEIISGAFRIVGIFHSNNARYENENVFVRQSDLKPLVSDTINLHEIAVLLKDQNTLDANLAHYQKAFPGLLVESWRDIAPELSIVIDMFNKIMTIFVFIIMLALAFGIINTMLMAILERTRELGMLMAIGMNKRRIFTMISMETVFLSLTGGPLGLLLAFLSVQFLGKHGIDLSIIAKGLSSLGFDSMVYPKLDGHYYWQVLIEVLLVTLVASIYPALKALSLNPVEAIRKL